MPARPSNGPLAFQSQSFITLAYQTPSSEVNPVA